MALKTVQWSNRGEKLSCAGATPSDIIICLKDGALLLNPLPPVGDIPCAFLDATICQYFALQSCPSIWLYTFQYDDEQLADVNVPITCDDITGVFCRNCLTDWIECHFGESSTICVEDTNTLNLSISEETGCVFGDVLISADDGNIIEARDDGLYGRQLLCVEDTTSINFEVTEDNCITGAVKVSADGGNIISIHADGIFAAGGGGGGNDWHILGNSDIVDGTHFLGTTNTVAVDFRTNNVRSLRLQPSTGVAPDIIGGHPLNAIILDALGQGNGILSGGFVTKPNIIGGTDFVNNSVIAGGEDNLIDGGVSGAFLGAGEGNIIDTFEVHPVLGGGQFNHIGAFGSFNTIGGGTDNTIDGDENDSYSGNTISGGEVGTITSSFDSTIGGGFNNLLDLTNTFHPGLFTGYNTVCGGRGNTILATDDAFIGGGEDNFILGNNVNSTVVPFRDVIVGGLENYIAFVLASGAPFSSGGVTDFAPHDNLIGAGRLNSILNGAYSIIGSGVGNLISTAQRANSIPNSGAWVANGVFSGNCNQVVASTRSLVGGGQAHIIDGQDVSGIFSGFNNIIVADSDPVDPVNPNAFFGSCLTDTPTNHEGGTNRYNAILSGFQNEIHNGYLSVVAGGGGVSIGAKTFAYHVVADPINPGTDGAILNAFSNLAYFGNVDTWFANTDGTARKAKFLEPNTDLDFSSTNFSSFRAQAQSADIDYIWPAAAGIAGQQLTIDTVVGTTVTLKWA